MCRLLSVICSSSYIRMKMLIYIYPKELGDDGLEQSIVGFVKPAANHLLYNSPNTIHQNAIPGQYNRTFLVTVLAIGFTSA